MKKNDVLVLGGLGFLGSTLVEQLCSHSEELNIDKITIFDSSLFKDDGAISVLRHPKVELIIGDVRDEALLKKLVQAHNVVYPFSALVGAPRCALTPDEAWDVNYNSIKNIVRYAAPDTKIIYPNTNSIFGQSDVPVDEESSILCLSVYAESKYEAEVDILEFGGISLRLATLAGLSAGRQRRDLLVNSTILAALNPGYILLYEPHFQRCYISVADAARAFIHALANYEEMKGRAFNTGNTALNCSKAELTDHIKRYIPNFIVKVEEFTKDPDQRSYIVKNDRLEATGFKCKDDFDVIIPQVIKGYKLLLNCSSRHTNL